MEKYGRLELNKFQKKRIEDYGFDTDIPVIGISKDPMHSVQFAAAGFNVVGAIVPNYTIELEKLAKNYEFEYLSYNKFVEEKTGKKWIFPISELELHDLITGYGRTHFSLGIYDSFRDKVDVLLENVIDEYGELFIETYMNSSEIKKIEKHKGVNVIGTPEPEIRELFSSKTKTFDIIKNETDVPIVEGEVARDVFEAMEIFNENKKDWGLGAFVSGDTGSGDSSIIHAKTEDEIYERFSNYNNGILIQKWITTAKGGSPNILCIASENPQVIAITSQRMDGTRYTGNHYPASLNSEQIKYIKEYCSELGTLLYEKKYRGIFGVDLMIVEGKDEEIFFGEINPRKNHSTVQNTFMYELNNKEKIPLSVLDAMVCFDYSVNNSDISEMKDFDFSWVMHNYSSSDWRKIVSNIEFSEDRVESLLFKNFINNKEPTHTIVNIIPEETNIPQIFKATTKEGNDSYISNEPVSVNMMRIVSIGNNPLEANEEIEKGKRKIKKRTMRY